MRLIYLFLVCCFFYSFDAQGQNAPKRELRGAWIATYANIDWPSSGASTATEQSTFIQRVNEHKATGMNAIFAQVRSQCDAIYPSPYDPWSAVISGTQGVAPTPYYDPLQFMINETKQRGMEFHAWFNPYRALASFTTTSYNNLAATHVAKVNPSWIMTVSNNAPSTVKQLLLNPGAPEVWEHIIASVMHVVRNYDVDGIHFDDYFYTNPASTTYNDDSVYAIHNRGIANRGDWRRSNVDTLIKRLNDSIKSVKPWIKFGISPSGIWMSSPTDPNGSTTSTGALQHKKDLYANSRLWLEQGWVDYLAPQVYWYIGQSGSDYNNLAPWWSSNSFTRHIYMGQAGYKVGDGAQNAAFATDRTQIPRQVRLNRTLAGIKGQIVYNTTSLRNNPLNFRDSLTQNLYNKPALLPTMSWKDNTAPDPATSLTATRLPNNNVSLLWVKPSPAVIAVLDSVKRFAIYRSENTVPDINNVDHLLHITNTDVTSYEDATALPNVSYNYVVTAVDRLYNESIESNVANAGIVLPLTLINFDVEKDLNNNASITWQTANEINTAYFDVERSVNNSSFTRIVTINARGGGGLGYSYATYDQEMSVNGIYLYRLKMVDQDGRFTYSNVKSLNVSVGFTNLSVYPNPIQKGGQLQLLWPTINGRVSYKLIQSNGGIVAQGGLNFNAGRAQLTLSNKIAAGVYLLQYFYDKKEYVVKINVM